ncbi:PD-(D/E)XK nuclease superfamily protein [Salinimicrobium sediminis]|uniref:PD-(D/E)XK nuclease superfamily protein n=1 Tax=Salinimicrobium sediminis TaxID=1343891 RepID=A0A285X1N0_9FLAO|nr:PD-(D/E)XK nuclease family protein [Salinimicrobium sediminis]SOC79253.1 PD-(D/E)XK nuclease superfamily protein [Salinimicrobium sediminis]
MTSFIEQVLLELLSRKVNISATTFILPSKRAGSFLINKLSKHTKNPIFAPRVLSIEDFAEEVAGLSSVDNITALFEFYAAYLTCTPKEKAEDFDTFATWAQTLLHDFNEIDRYLIDYKSFFGYLGNIQEMNHWYLQEEKTPLMENYLLFWNKLPEYYEELQKQLEKRNQAYQGMVYRRASENIRQFAEAASVSFVFIGFNALNNAEQNILQTLLAAGKAEVFWDIDEIFLKDDQHDVSLFLRQYLKSWPYYQENRLNIVSNSYSSSKNINMIGVPKNIGQAKYVGELLSKLSPEDLQQTAVVLGDESLLLPVLNSLPPNVGEVNITMGFALKNAPVSSLFEHLLKMHSTPGNDTRYYKDLMLILSHPLFQKVTGGHSQKLMEKLRKENLVYVTRDEIMEGVPGNVQKLFEICFLDWKNDPGYALQALQELLMIFKNRLDTDQDRLTLEFLYQLHLVVNQLTNLYQKYPYINSLKILFSLFKDLLASRTVDFRGKPFSGLQLMGMLESRVLDFKNVILTSVNEGVLPAGKSSNSFIPFDLKCKYNLPTYKEKDAVYTYHFYHLLQRAEQVHLLYNTESDGLNAGEKSRFLLQLEMEAQSQHQIKNFKVTPVVPPVPVHLKTIEKTPEILEKIKARAAAGFSPSALTTYIRNPLDFYKQYVLDLKEREEVEETVAYNTLGNVVHDTLETFYEPWLQSDVTIQMLERAMERTNDEIQKQFRNHYTQAPLDSGKNLLIYEVARRYVVNFLKWEIKNLEEGNDLKILKVEEKLHAQFPVEELDFPVFLKGTVDRVDEFNGKIRIIDYKTGKVEQSKVEVVEWEEINSDYDKYSKPFQILTYALMMDVADPLPPEFEAGIISFKNLQGGFLKFCKKDKKGYGAKKENDITSETLEAFKEQLKNLILEICDPETPFVEKEIKQNAW